MTQSYRLTTTLKNLAVYGFLGFFALIMLFPFVFMLTTSFKEPKDTFRYPPRLLPREPVTVAPETLGLEGRSHCRSTILRWTARRARWP